MSINPLIIIRTLLKFETVKIDGKKETLTRWLQKRKTLK